MSATTVETASLPPLNLTLQNGQKIRYHSDISIEADEIPVIDTYRDDIQARKAVAEKYNRNGKNEKDQMEAYSWGYDPKFNPEVASEVEPDVDYRELLWPKALPGFKETLYQHHSQLLTFARRLTKIFDLALHLDEDYFAEYSKTPAAGMRVTHYPPQEALPSDQLDTGAFTLIQAKPIPGSVVVNIADCSMRHTNAFFVSTVHRVFNNASAERYSCPFFFGFQQDMKLEPVPTCVSNINSMKYPIVSWGEYLEWRAEKAKKAA
ncbi:Clavaminate synthase-like protein [Karstenula rhodostoma CBS 690.94]|uniref:Clavaminate synthase-like protein n=1 Tax=Karstenula rhodostoma CBS 690.94 TaxID=1392251 RepID=A0A9P4PWR1_9PLEO|nr:Clavaminate synthase-like protein [Karstenula rhodostoma CBS 690.94]